MKFEEFRQWLESRGYASKTIYGVHSTLIKISKQMGDPNSLTTEDVRGFYWLSNQKVRSQCIHSIRLYKDYLNDNSEK